MVKLLLSFAADSFQTALEFATSKPGWLIMKMELRQKHVKNRCPKPSAITKICNCVPSYRVGEESRANLKRLTLLTNIYNSERYQIYRNYFVSISLLPAKIMQSLTRAIFMVYS
jgi:hypothetical protein